MCSASARGSFSFNRIKCDSVLRLPLSVILQRRNSSFFFWLFRVAPWESSKVFLHCGKNFVTFFKKKSVKNFTRKTKF